MENKIQPKEHKNGESMRRIHENMHSKIVKCKKEITKQWKMETKNGLERRNG